ncbi:MAG: hypothetical protein ACWA6U_01335 [Breznakibacter sp.]
MINALLYKEWIKLRWVFWLVLLGGLLVELYLFIRVGRSFRIAGAGHIWDVVVNRNQFLFADMRFWPLVAGSALALMQFIPEVSMKRLKLTLHLPMDEGRIILSMLSFGLLALMLAFGLQLLVLLGGISHFFAAPFVVSAISTVIPWYLGGLSAYLLIAFVCIEPSWTRRFINALVGIILVQLFFISTVPGAYCGFSGAMVFIPMVAMLWVFISVFRFKIGVQDK